MLSFFALLGVIAGIKRIFKQGFPARLVMLPLVTALGIPVLLCSGGHLTTALHIAVRWEVPARLILLILPLVALSCIGVLGSFGFAIPPDPPRKRFFTFISGIFGSILPATWLIGRVLYALEPVSKARTRVFVDLIGISGFVAISCMAAVAEEAFFRGFLVGKRASSTTREVLWQTFVAWAWAYMHRPSCISFIWLMLVGLLLSLVRRYIGLKASIAMHIGYNLFISVVPVFFES